MATASRTFGNILGPYQQASMSVVETDLNDGLESHGLFFLTRNFYNAYDGTPGNNLVLIGAHETAHQWFYGAISSDQAREPWLDEALCTYAELLFYETNYPGYVNWWWNARIRYYSPSGWVDTRLYNSGNFRAYVNAVYLRGALFLHDLRLRMGDAAFFAFLRDYYNRHNGYLATADTFFSVLADHTTNADDLIQSYFYYR
jgi:aminopeptidase N